MCPPELGHGRRIELQRRHGHTRRRGRSHSARIASRSSPCSRSRNLSVPSPSSPGPSAQNSHHPVTRDSPLGRTQRWGKTVGRKYASPVHAPPHAPALKCQPSSLTCQPKSLAHPTFPKLGPCPSRWVCLPPRRPLARSRRPCAPPGPHPCFPRVHGSQHNPHRAFFAQVNGKASQSGHSGHTERRGHSHRSRARGISPRTSLTRLIHTDLAGR